jgi:hypothetical protein
MPLGETAWRTGSDRTESSVVVEGTALRLTGPNSSLSL